MKHSYAVLFLLFFTAVFYQTQAQDNNQLILRTGATELVPNLDEFIATASTNISNYKLVHFNSTPTESIKSQLKSQGVIFLEYVPNNSFIVKFSANSNASFDFLKGKNIQGVYELPEALKLDYRLIDWNIPSHAQVDNDIVKAAIITMNGLNVKDYIARLQLENVAPYTYGKDKRFAYCNLSKAQIDNLVQKPWIRSIELIDEPGKPESTEGRSIQKSNIINNELGNGLTYNADGVNLLVRDDGLVGPHIDYEGRLINLTTDAVGTHGDGVGGVMGGAGNLDPTVEGGASGAGIYVINYTSTFQDTTLGLHQNHGVMITNSSYSNGCNAGYTSTTQTVDKQIFDNQTLMHVFSAGNSNNNNCGYGAGNQWGNITGGHKMGKNVITVANLFSDGSLVSSSSRGPAHDGRIKPDLAAHGQGQQSTNPNNTYVAFGGTSAAAPSLAGNLGQLIEAYRDLNSNTDPKSSLIKAAALNSATDLGNAGPDFRFGYGMINTARAYDIIANNQYLFANISQSGTNNHTVTVPAGVGQLRIMIYWHDPEGTVNTNKALVNDLDMTVNTTLLPLVLDETANATTLNNPAAPGVDHLNNMEQVVVNNPTPGNFAVQVSGFQIPSGPQEYVLVYTFIKDEIKVTYPLGGESLVPGNSEIIHWDAYGNTGNFTVEYSTNNGSSWNNIASVPGDERNVSWTVPSTNTADALVRVSRGTQNDVSDANVNIFPVPSFTIQNNNASSVQVNWNNIAGATKYYIWRLGTKFMEVIDSSTTNQYILGGLNGGENLWLSVSANTATIEGERAIAKNFVFNPFGSCGGCINSFTNFPHIEDLETGLGLFCQSASDDIDFTIWSNGTPSNNTGPSSASEGSEYIYVEATNPNFPAKTAILGSPCYDLTNKIGQLKFDYHMYGANMGSLEIEVSIDGGQTWSSTPIWSKSGDQGNQWFTDSVNFSLYQTNQVSYRFVGTTGTSFTSDIALDDISFSTLQQSPLPVTYLNWGVQWSGQHALLDWTTQTEENNSHFDVERSIDNIHFEKIGIVKSKNSIDNNVQYSFTDLNAKNLPADKIYYRLRQVDNDQKINYSEILSLINSDRPIFYTIKPNPSDGIFNLNTIENLKSIKVVNSFGQTVTNVTVKNQDDHILNLTEFASGIYFVLLQDKSNTFHRLKISVL